jgi:hypothetical protein
MHPLLWTNSARASRIALRLRVVSQDPWNMRTGDKAIRRMCSSSPVEESADSRV